MRKRQVTRPKTSKTSYSNNVVDFSKKKRDLSHIQLNPNVKKKSISFNGVKLVKAISIVFLLLVVALSAQFFLNSPYATIQVLTLEGNFLLDKQEILSHLPKVGQANFFSTSKKHYAQSLKEMKEIKWIKEVHVERNFLDRSVEIIIEERRPLYRIMKDNELHIIDEEGVILTNLPSIVGVSVPVVVGSENEELLKALVKTLKPLPDYFLHVLAEINLDNPNTIYLYTLDKFIIQIGEFSNLTQERVEEIIQIMNIQKNQQNTGTIDIRGRNIIFKPVEGSS